MKRDELSHIIRAAARILDDPNVVVIGSQSILASYPEVTLLGELTFSIEADILPLGGDDDADKIDGAIGEGSHFHQTFGVYGQNVGARTAVLPNGWKDRLVPLVDVAGHRCRRPAEVAKPTRDRLGSATQQCSHRIR